MPDPTDPPVLVLFRRDLRRADNGALAAAAASDRPVVAAFVLDEESPGTRPLGHAARWWLHQSLAALDRSLGTIGLPLVLRRGPMAPAVAELVAATGADTVLWNRRYDPAAVAADTAMKRALRDRGLRAESFDGALLHEPSRLARAGGGSYKVFTPFWQALARAPEPRAPRDAPGRIRAYGNVPGFALADLGLLPTTDWAAGLREAWTPGEDGAHTRLAAFLAGALDGYATRRDQPAGTTTSRLSPHLAHGEITPFQILAALRDASHPARPADAAKFRAELGWREFCHHLLFHAPDLAERNFRPGFDAFPWTDDPAALGAWQRGRTGYPIVDAGVRELWATGWMHNRVRMIAASFLTKHLLLDWRQGERWFWDTLVDADPASNPANWQWVAGSGADAAPFFRIFNPLLQGEKFDPSGAYVRRWLPELARLPDRWLHRPWQAPVAVLAEAGVTLGRSYPRPIVDHATARARALAAWQAMRDVG